MSKRTGIFNNVAYDASDYSVPFHLMFTNGVFLNDIYGEDALKVTIVPNSMVVSIADGSANINGKWVILEGETLTISQGDLYPRIDRVVLRLNLNQEVNDIVLDVKKGTPAVSNPIPPSLQRDNTIYEISLATVTVPANATNLNDAEIIDDREDRRVCGFVTPLPDPYFELPVHYVVGTYVGDGQPSRIIDLGFTPSAVYLGNIYVPPFVAYYNSYGLAIKEYEGPGFNIVENGIEVIYEATSSSYDAKTNANGYRFYYIAFV